MKYLLINSILSFSSVAFAESLEVPQVVCNTKIFDKELFYSATSAIEVQVNDLSLTNSVEYELSDLQVEGELVCVLAKPDKKLKHSGEVLCASRDVSDEAVENHLNTKIKAYSEQTKTTNIKVSEFVVGEKLACVIANSAKEISNFPF